MKISIIGYSVSGKSTLAKLLSKHYNCEVMHLDRVNFVDNWQERNLDEAQKIVNDFISKDVWIIEGNYQKLNQTRRFENSDLIIFMNFPRYICLPRAIKRYFKNRGNSRDDIGENCKEKFDFDFFLWILYQGRSKQFKNHYQMIINKYSDKSITINNPKELEAFLSSRGIN